jgi:hypothetical protein
MLPIVGKAVPRQQRWAVHLKQIVPRDLCRDLIRETERIGYKNTFVNQRDSSSSSSSSKCVHPKVRNNACIEVHRSSLSIKLMELCRAYIPVKLLLSVPVRVEEQDLARFPGPLVRRMHCAGLNEHLHFSKHVDTDAHFFAAAPAHTDMSIETPISDTRSLLTLQVYLNDDYKGGETSLQRESIDGKAEWQDVRAIRTGDVLLFDHTLLHRANSVTLGTKYTLRTDVFYSS